MYKTEIINEIWKDITDYPSYQVSNFGRIKNLNTNNILKGSPTNGGYIRATLIKDKKNITKKVHCLVAIEFLNYKFDSVKSVVNYIDGDKTNNKLENLEVVTQRENKSNCFRSNSETMTSKYIGVSFHKASNKWISQIRINGINTYLGVFKTEIEAHNRYNEELLKLTTNE